MAPCHCNSQALEGEGFTPHSEPCSANASLAFHLANASCFDLTLRSCCKCRDPSILTSCGRLASVSPCRGVVMCSSTLRSTSRRPAPFTTTSQVRQERVYTCTSTCNCLQPADNLFAPARSRILRPLQLNSFRFPLGSP